MKSSVWLFGGIITEEQSGRFPACELRLSLDAPLPRFPRIPTENTGLRSAGSTTWPRQHLLCKVRGERGPPPGSSGSADWPGGLKLRPFSSPVSTITLEAFSRALQGPLLRSSMASASSSRPARWELPAEQPAVSMETAPAQTGRVRQMPMEQWNLTTASPPPAPPDSRDWDRKAGETPGQTTEVKKRDTSDWQASLDRMHCFYKIKWKNQVPQVYLENDTDARIRTCGYI